jgi:hypothetical protein
VVRVFSDQLVRERLVGSDCWLRPIWSEGTQICEGLLALQ